LPASGRGFAFAKKGNKVEVWVDRWAEGWIYGGVYRFSSLVKQKIKGENYAVFCFAGKRFFFYIYDLITWEK
jgi:hypothetical protein